MTDTTKAQIEVPTATIAVPQTIATGGGILSAVFALLAGAMIFRRRLSRDSLEIAKDRSEESLIKNLQQTITSLQEQNLKLDQNAREAWRTRADDAQRIGELSTKVEHMTQVNEHLENSVQQLQARVMELTAMLRMLLPPEQRLHFEVHGNIPKQPLNLENPS